MFLTKVCRILILVLLLTASLLAAPEGRLSLDYVDGNISGSQIGPGPATFYIRLETYSSGDILKGFSTGFRIYSPDGANWLPIAGDTINGIADPFDLVFTIKEVGVTGAGADTLGFGGSVLFNAGLQPGYNEQAFTISTEIYAADDGKTICLDSTFYPPSGVWLWAGGSNGNSKPEWLGPYCFTINDCLGTSGPDRDSDGLPDSCDDCPDDPDNDIDGDGICGNVDNCPNVNNPQQDDADNDNIGDECDSCTDTDNDGYGNPGFPANTCPEDNCPDVYNPDQNDADSDGTGDECDTCTDTDGDGYGDPGFSANTCSEDNCPDIYNPDQDDYDSDGIGDDCDTCFDLDGDGFGDPGYDNSSCFVDNCPDVYNPTQTDADSDGIGDDCDECTDTDGDGFGDPGYPFNTCQVDNCPTVYNPSQSDIDGDGKGDACDVGEVVVDADVRCGAVPLTVNFSFASTSSTVFTSWHWFFGDGSESFDEDPIHVYNTEGSFDVKVVFSDGIVSDSLTLENFITTQSDINIDFKAYPNTGKAPLSVMFNPVSDGIATDYLWDFGDGSVSIYKNTFHVYENPGLYTVKLLAVLDLDGCYQRDSVVKEYYILVRDFKTSFIADTVGGTSPLTVHFYDNSSGYPSYWLWNFGDGTTSNLQNPIHTYTDTGKFDVSLLVSRFYANDPVVESDSLIKYGYIKVSTNPKADLSVSISPGYIRPNQNFSLSYSWTNISTAQADDCVLKIKLPDNTNLLSLNPISIQSGTYGGYITQNDTLVIDLGSISPTSWHGGTLKAELEFSQNANYNDILRSEVWLETSTKDINSRDNHYLLEYKLQPPSAKYEKFAYPGGSEKLYEIYPYTRINYILRFENEIDAINSLRFIRLSDTLSDKLDWGSLTFDFLSNEDSCYYEFDSYNGVVSLNCNQVMLPPNANPPEGELYLGFSVMPQKDILENAEIPNNAVVRYELFDWDNIPVDGLPLVRKIKFPPCCYEIRGNIDNDPDDIIDITDLVFYAEYQFARPPGPEPPCFEEADVNAVDGLDIEDIVYLVSYMFDLPPGPAPLDCPSF